MINFEEELKKFHPSLEVEDAEEAIYNQDMTDVADIMVKMIKDVSNETTFNGSVMNDAALHHEAVRHNDAVRHNESKSYRDEE